MKHNKLLRIFELISMCIIAGLPSSNALPFHHDRCKSDSDCRQPNFYCYESRECVECTNCSFYNRQINPSIKCAKTKDNCGNCTSGMEAELNFDGTFTCSPISATIPINNSHNNQNPIDIDLVNNWWLYLSIPFVVLSFISCVALVIKFKLCSSLIKRILPNNDCPNVEINHRNNNNIENNNESGVPPPPYSPPYPEKSPSAPPEEDPLIPRLRISHDDNQCAIPSHNPYYVRGGTYSDNPIQLENDGESPSSPTSPATPAEGAGISDEDENTQPSSWYPNVNDLNNQTISFSNILSATRSPDPPPNQPNRSTENTPENTESSGTIPALSVASKCNL